MPLVSVSNGFAAMALQLEVHELAIELIPTLIIIGIQITPAFTLIEIANGISFIFGIEVFLRDVRITVPVWEMENCIVIHDAPQRIR